MSPNFSPIAASPIAAALIAGVLVLASLGSAAAQTEDRREVAAALFQESADAYLEGRFEVAVALLQRAYELDPAPVLQYNLARALEGMGMLEDAIEAYQLYLSLEPEARDRGAIEARLETLEGQLAVERELEARETAEPEPEPEPEAQPMEEAPSPGSVAPFVLVAGGALVLGGALVTGLVASGRHDDAVDAPSHAEAVDLSEQADTLAKVTNIQLVVGSLLAAGGLTWAIIDLVKRGDDEPSVAVGLTPGGALLRGRF